MMKSRFQRSGTQHLESKAGGVAQKVYFSCPGFTVRLVLEGSVIANAAPVVKAFEGQTIGDLTSWVRAKFGGPIMIEEIS
jgi:hypothetical protein